MVDITIKGGTKKQRKLVESALHFSLKRLLPRFRVMTLDIVLGKFEHCGLCKPYSAATRNTFEIELDKSQDSKELLKTVFHEMTHVKQYCRKEWQVTGTTPERWRTYWLGSDHTNTPYYRQPWEIEARWMQDILYRDFKKMQKEQKSAK